MLKSKKHLLILTSLAAFTIGLSGCGGSQPASNSGITSDKTISIVGVVVDGYMEGATAFVDRNNNGQLDADEPHAITDEDGRYTLKDLKEGDEFFPIVASIPKDAIDSDTGEAVGTASVMTTPAPGTLKGDVVISPITTMIKTTMDSTPNADKYEAEDAVRKKLGVSNVKLDLFADYVASKTDSTKTKADKDDFSKVHNVAQVVARAVAAQVADVYSAAKNADANTTLADVIAIITHQVISQLATIESEVATSTATWDFYTSGASIALYATIPVDTNSANFNQSVTNQINLTLAATKKAEADVNTALAAAKVSQATADMYAQQAATDAAAAGQAKDAAQATLDKAQKLLLDLQAAKAVQDQYAQNAQQKQIAAAQSVQTDVYTNVQAQAIKVNAAAAADPYAYSVTQLAAINNAVQTTAAARPPIVSAPASITVEATGALTAVTLNMGTALDHAGNALTPTVNNSGPFAVGTHAIIWSAIDVYGNKGIALQTVNITDTTAPTITLNNALGITTLPIGGTYTEQGATASDIVDGAVTVSTTGTVDTATAADYIITYTAQDAAGNKATTTHTVRVAATVPAQISGTFTNNSTATGALLIAVAQQAGSTVNATINTTGNTYTINGLADGNYYVVLFSDLNANGIQEKAEPIAFQLVTVVAGQPLTNINLSLEQYGAIGVSFYKGIGASSIMFELSDPMLTASSVSVTGPGLAAPLAIIYNANRGRWSGSTANNMTLVAGATYTYTVVDAVGTSTFTESLSNPIITQAPTNVLPANGSIISSTPTFSWNAVTVSGINVRYGAQLSGGSIGFWESYVNTTSVTYNNAPLADGVYNLSITAEFNDLGAGIMHHATFSPNQSFTYQATPTAQISGTITNNSTATGPLAILVWPSSGTQPAGTVVVTGNNYTINGLADGDYAIDAFVDANGDGFTGGANEPAAQAFVSVVGGIGSLANSNFLIEQYRANGSTTFMVNTSSYGVQFELQDAMTTATSVTVSGAGVAALPLTYDAPLMTWVGQVDLYASSPAGGVFNYTITAATGTVVVSEPVMAVFPTAVPVISSPTVGSIWNTAPVFTWTPIAKTRSMVEMWGANGMYWKWGGGVGTVTYNGAALASGTYSYMVASAFYDTTGGGAMRHVNAVIQNNALTYQAPVPPAQISGAIVNNSTSPGSLAIVVFDAYGTAVFPTININTVANTYTIDGLANGAYDVVAFMDKNFNGTLDNQELLDPSTSITVNAGVLITRNFTIGQYFTKAGPDLRVRDFMATATTVTLSGTGVVGTENLVFDIAVRDWKRAIATVAVAGTYTFTVTDNLAGMTILTTTVP